MSTADHELNFEEQTRIAMGFSEEDSQDRDLQAALQASLYSEQLRGEDIELYNGIAASLGINVHELSDAEKRELYANIAASPGHDLYEPERPDGPAIVFDSHAAAIINRETDEAYTESVRIDAENEASSKISGFLKANLKVKKEKQRAAAAARVQARRIEDQRFIAEFTSQYLNDGDVSIKFDYKGAIQILQVKLNTPIDLLAHYASSTHLLDNVQLIIGNTQLLPGTNLSNYVKSGGRVKIIIEGERFVGGFKVRNSLKNKKNVRQTSKRQTSKRQTSKRQISKRQISKRQISKRQISKRQISKRQISKRIF
jgi:hypothetical protein